MTSLTTEPAGTSSGGGLSELARSVDLAALPGPAWLGDIRRSAAEAFERLGLPSRRDEEWRYTSLRRIESASFAPSAGAGVIDASSLARMTVDVPGAVRVVFVDGVLSTALSSPLDGLAGGLTVLPIEEAASSHEGIVRPELERSAASVRDGFEALSASLMDHGVFVHAAKDAVIETPIVVTAIETGRGGSSAVSTPRVVVVAERGSSVRVVEEYVGVDGGVYLRNPATDVVVGENADVEHTLLERESVDAFHVSTLRATQERSSRFTSHRMILGGGLVRNNVWPTLAGDGCHSVLNGLFVGDGRQHLDNHMRVVHERPHGDSRQYYRGLLGGESSGVFTGRIFVAKPAQKTDAIQSNSNLLLSDHATVTSKPQLEIYADDVRCTHGATTGQIDDEAMFYLRARGIPETDARLMLLFAFAGENLDRIGLEPVREAVRREIEAKLTRMLASGSGPR